MCSSDESNYALAYQAAQNALNYGYDYSNGACWWDGYDLKADGKKAYRYLAGFTYTDPLHNIFSTPEPLPKGKITARGTYDYAFETTAAYGGTIFFKYTDDFIYATRSTQCH